MRKLDDLINEIMTPEAIAKAEARTDVLIAGIETARARAAKTKKKRTKHVFLGKTIRAKARNIDEQSAVSPR